MAATAEVEKLKQVWTTLNDKKTAAEQAKVREEEKYKQLCTEEATLNAEDAAEEERLRGMLRESKEKGNELCKKGNELCKKGNELCTKLRESRAKLRESYRQGKELLKERELLEVDLAARKVEDFKLMGVKMAFEEESTDKLFAGRIRIITAPPSRRDRLAAAIVKPDDMQLARDWMKQFNAMMEELEEMDSSILAQLEDEDEDEGEGEGEDENAEKAA